MFRTAFYIAALLALAAGAQAGTTTTSCEYFNSSDNKNFDGPCLLTTIEKDSQKSYAVRITMPGIDLEILYLKHQGPYHRWTINGANAGAYEIDRTHICGFTDDLVTSICIKPSDTSRSSVTEESATTNAKPFFVGRWHIDNRRLCRGQPGETEGLLTYTEREFIGLENRCQIVKATPQANRIELQLKCNGEGMTSSEREVVQLLRNGRLSRTTFDGKNAQTFEYAKCP